MSTPAATVEAFLSLLHDQEIKASQWPGTPNARQVFLLEKGVHEHLVYVLTSETYAFWGATKTIVDALDRNQKVSWSLVLLLGAGGGCHVSWRDACSALDDEDWTNSGGNLKIHGEKLDKWNHHPTNNALVAAVVATMSGIA